MHRRSPWTVPPLLGLSVALGACTNPAATFDAEQAQRRAGWAAQRTVAQESARQRREAIRQVALPPDYREQIDANFVRTLKDPDSRKVVYHGNPYGSLVLWHGQCPQCIRRLYGPADLRRLFPARRDARRRGRV